MRRIYAWANARWCPGRVFGPCLQLQRCRHTQGRVHATPLQAAFVTILIGVPLFLLAALLLGQVQRADEVSASSYALLAASGIVNFVGGRYFNYRAIDALGLARAAPFQAISLPYSILIAFIFLGEGLSAVMILAVGLIIVGPAIMVERRLEQEPGSDVLGPERNAVALRLRQRQVEGYFYAIVAAVAYGTSPILIRAAIEDSSAVALLGGLVAHAAAAIVLLSLAVSPVGTELRQAISVRVFRTFLFAGLLVFLAQVLRFLALALAPIAIATALERTQIVFTFLLAYKVNQALELITLRVAFGVLASSVGAVLLVATLAY